MSEHKQATIIGAIKRPQSWFRQHKILILVATLPVLVVFGGWYLLSDRDEEERIPTAEEIYNQEIEQSVSQLDKEIAAAGTSEAKTSGYNSKGSLLMSKGDYRRALEAFEQAAKISPKDPTSTSNIGSAYFKLQDKENTIKYYNTAIALAKDYSMADYQYNIKIWQGIVERVNNNDFNMPKADATSDW